MRQAPGQAFQIARNAFWSLGRRQAAAHEVPPQPVPSADLPSSPPIKTFRNVQVIPPSRPFEKGEGAYPKALRRSGPVWPDFESQTWARHVVEDEIVDVRPTPARSCNLVIADPCIWMGLLRPHFGHLVAEYLTRLLWSRTLRPHDRLLFTVVTGKRADDVPGFFWDIMDWYGVPREQVVVLQEPALIRELRVVPQAEPLDGHGPDAAYLDLLDRHVGRSGLVPIPSEFLYVGRPGMIEVGHAAHVGEGYLMGHLERRGVRILDPGTVPLRQQLALYAGARTIIFAEGSAAHGRQLLGRIDQRIMVLKRRPSFCIAQNALAPRCSDLRYIDATRAICEPVRLDGGSTIPIALAFYDLDRIFDSLGAVGLDPAPGWSDEAYRSACETDVATWIEVQRSRTKRFDFEATLAALDAIPPGRVPDGSGPWHRGRFDPIS